MPRLIVFLAAVLLVAGCGGADSPNGAEVDEVAVLSGSLSKDQFIRRGDVICRARRQRIEDEFAAFLERNGGLASSRADLATAAEEVTRKIYLPAGEAQIDGVRALGAPSGDEKEVAAILDAFQAGLEEAESHPVRFVRALDAAYAPFAQAERLAAAYGFEECGKG